MTRLPADENIPRTTVDTLKKSNLDIVSVTDISPGLSDREVIDLANRENRVIVTFDKDFGELIFRERLNVKGLILLRIHPFSPEYIAERIRHTINPGGLCRERGCRSPRRQDQDNPLRHPYNKSQQKPLILTSDDKPASTHLSSSTPENDQDVNVLEVEHLVKSLKAKNWIFEYKIYPPTPGAHGFSRLGTSSRRGYGEKYTSSVDSTLARLGRILLASA